MCNYKNKPLLCSDCDKSFNMPKNMPKKVKGTKFCPEDYNNAEQSDSDQHSDPDYIYEPTSPKISQGKGGCDTFKKRQMEKSMKSTATPKSTKGGNLHQQLLHLLHLKQVLLENANEREL